MAFKVLYSVDRDPFLMWHPQISLCEIHYRNIFKCSVDKRCVALQTGVELIELAFFDTLDN